MNALVTGGAGFLGLYLAEQLAARGDRVRVLSRRPHRRLDELGAEWQEGDIRHPHNVDRACRNMDTVFHVAGVPGIWGSWQHYYETNTLGTQHILDACCKHQIARLVYTSSPSVIYDGADQINVDESHPYPSRYLCYYPHTKVLAERQVLAANGRDGLATVALRPHLIWGPRDNHLVPRLIARARSGRLRRVGRGDNVISMSYVENAAAAHLQAADALHLGAPPAGNAYFINEAQPVNLWHWIDELLSLAGLPPVHKSISARAAYFTGATLEAIYKTLRISGEPPMTRFLAQQLSGSHTYQIGRAERDFGYKPLVTVEEGMRRLAPELKRLGEGRAA